MKYHLPLLTLICCLVVMSHSMDNSRQERDKRNQKAQAECQAKRKKKPDRTEEELAQDAIYIATLNCILM